MMVSSQAQSKNKPKRWWPFVVTPFFIGICWTLLHPLVSVLTGDLRCRNGYIDENSLEPSNLRSESVYSMVKDSRQPTNTKTDSLLCDALTELSQNRTNVSCHRHSALFAGSFDVARLVPTGTTFEPSNEAIALAVPAPFDGWSTSQLHFSLLEMLKVLSSPQSAPWLAKTILVVSSAENASIYETVDLFLDSYMGIYDNTRPARIEPLPPNLSNAMIRNLLILGSEQSTSTTTPDNKDINEIQILPHGRHGVLPNMDLVFVTKSVFARSATNSGPRKRGAGSANLTPTLQVHPHSQAKQQFTNYIKENFPQLPSNVQQWAISMGDLVLFAYTLFRGPYGAHSLALDRGIDAITIEGRYGSRDNESVNRMVVDYVQKLEITIRALSNLHERLHHSTTLYLLPSAYKFVKHEESLIPNLLLLVPLVVRAATLALNDIRQFNLRVMGWMLLIALGATLGIDSFVAQQYEGELESSEQQTKQNTLLAMTYAASLALFYEKVLRQRSKARELQGDTRSAFQSAQLVVCLVAIYVHVPITFGHISLAYPSALLWVPWLAFPSFADGYRSKLFSLVVLIWLVLTWPPVALLPLLFSGALPAYVRFVYFPLHILFSLSCILGFLEGGKL